MKLSFRIFFSIFFCSVGISAAVSLVFYSYSFRQTEKEFKAHYEGIANTLSESLFQFEEKTDLFMKNVLHALEERLASGPLLSNTELKTFSEKLSATHLYVIASNGSFIRSTKEHPGEIPNFFSFCKHYKSWFESRKTFYPTGIVPGIPTPMPHKFLVLPTKDRKYILEVGMEVDFIGRSLKNALTSDKNILSVSLTAPNGTNLGTFGPDGSSYYGTMPASKYLFVSPKIVEEKVLTVNRKVKATYDYCCTCETRGLTQDGKYFYFLQFKVSKESLQASLKGILIFSFFIFGTATILSFFFSAWLSKNLVDEVILLERSTARIQTAEQVAHDIRSPLAALEIMLRSLNGLPEEERQIFRSAVTRIKDIANSLMARNTKGRLNTGVAQNSAPNGQQSKPNEVQLLPSLIETVVTESRIRFRSRLNLEIELKMNPSSYGLFALVDPGEFMRIVSNLINNSAEAIEDKGEILILISGTSTEANVKIIDNGKGIPDDLLPALGTRGMTYGKQNGSGLGLYHAKKMILSWGGSLDIRSGLSGGTSIEIRLARAKPPFS